MARKSSSRLVLYILKYTPTTRTFYLITLVSLTLFFLLTQNNTKSDYMTNESVQQEIIKSVAIDARYGEVLRKISRHSKDIKYILLWTDRDWAPFTILGNGQEEFIKRKCSVINCYVTDDRHLFDGDLSRFHAIAFNGRNIGYLLKKHLPQKRWRHQKYIYFNTESADYFPVCNKMFDDFFNWTATYRLDSDIRNPYVLIRDSDGVVVGPKRNMKWVDKTGDIDQDILNKVKNRTKTAAWFVSNCKSKSQRLKLFKSLQKALNKYKLTVDVYGDCGNFKCPRNNHSDCVQKLEREYFFYFSWENSFAEDYVTEKILTAMQHHVVPIVYGAANYSRFLSPSSYLNAKEMPVSNLAKEMNDLVHDPARYLKFLRWTSHYTYHNPWLFENVCALCEALNSKMYEEHSTYTNFRSWWNPQYKKYCPQ